MNIIAIGAWAVRLAGAVNQIKKANSDLKNAVSAANGDAGAIREAVLEYSKRFETFAEVVDDFTREAPSIDPTGRGDLTAKPGTLDEYAKYHSIGLALSVVDTVLGHETVKLLTSELSVSLMGKVNVTMAQNPISTLDCLNFVVTRIVNNPVYIPLSGYMWGVYMSAATVALKRYRKFTPSGALTNTYQFLVDPIDTLSGVIDKDDSKITYLSYVSLRAAHGDLTRLMKEEKVIQKEEPDTIDKFVEASKAVVTSLLNELAPNFDCVDVDDATLFKPNDINGNAPLAPLTRYTTYFGTYIGT
jgi:hypothetical protein